MGFASRVGGTLAARALGLAVGIASSILTARWLGAEGRGVLATLSALNGLLLQAGNLGLHSSSVYFVAREPHHAGRVLTNATWFALVIGAVAGAAGLGVWAIRPDWLPGIPLLLVVLAAAGMPFQFLILYLQNALLGLQAVRAFNLFEIAHRLGVFLLLAVWLLVFSGGVRGAVVLFTAAAVLFGVASVVYCARRVPMPGRGDAALMKRMVRLGSVSYVGCLLSFVVLRADMLMVNAILGTAAAGIYSIAAQIGEALLLLPVTVGMILFPRIAAAAPEARETITARVARHTVLLNTLACGAAFVLAGPVIVWLYGEPFRQAVAATRWLLPGIWALGLHSVLMNHFAGQGMPPVTILAPAVGAVLNVALNAWALPRFGVVAASMTSSAAYLAMLGVSLGVFLRSGRAGLRDSLLLAPGEVIGLLRVRL